MARTDGETVTVYVGDHYETQITNLAPDPSFETGTGWTDGASSVFPATGSYRGTSGIATEHTGSYGYGISNLAYGYVYSDPIPVSAGTDYDLYAWQRGEVDLEASLGTNWILRAYYYDAQGGSLGSVNAATGDGSTVSETWTQKGGRFTTPANTATVRIYLFFYNGSGWVTYDDVSLIEVGTSTNLVPNPGFETTSNWTGQASSVFPATGLYRGTSGIASERSGSYGYAISNLAYGYLYSDHIPVSASTEYDLHAWARGEVDPDASMGTNWIVRAYYYNSSGGYLGYVNAESGDGSTITETWDQKGARITTPANTATARIYLYFYDAAGWLTYDDISLIKVGTSTNLAPNPGFETSAGWGESPSAYFPATSFYRGTSGTAGERSGSYGYGISNLAYGYLYSDPIPVAANTAYDLHAWQRGEVDLEASVGSNWIVRAYYYNTQGGSLGYTNAEYGDGSTISEAWQEKGEQITTPANTTTVRIYLYFYNGSGWVTYDDVTLSATAGTATATETTYYTFGGERVAMRTNGDLVYLFGDHLGSTSVTYQPENDETLTQRYYPYGAIRTTDGLDTDVGFSGQRLDPTGLMYYRARYYDPMIGRFTQADTIIPNPTDPQDLNRYTYVGNNPTNHTDPTGHCYVVSTGPDSIRVVEPYAGACVLNGALAIDHSELDSDREARINLAENRKAAFADKYPLFRMGANPMEYLQDRAAIEALDERYCLDSLCNPPVVADIRDLGRDVNGLEVLHDEARAVSWISGLAILACVVAKVPCSAAFASGAASTYAVSTGVKFMTGGTLELVGCLDGSGRRCVKGAVSAVGHGLARAAKGRFGPAGDVVVTFFFDGVDLSWDWWAVPSSVHGVWPD